MKTERVFWGIILVFIGIIFLLENFGVIDFSWRYVWRFWPIILIISGVNILFSRYNNKVASIIVGFITLIGLGLLTYKGLETKHSNSREVFNEDWEENNSLGSSFFSEEFNEKNKFAKLEISGGASSFEIDSSTEKLFEANNEETNHNYSLRKTDYDSLVNLSFVSKGIKDLRIKENGLGEIKMKLNAQPIWDIKLNMGAGETDFDFEKFKIRTLNLKGGAAEFNLKLGSLLDTVNVSVETGLATVNIDVPEQVGCSIKSSSGLSAKDFEGFVDKGKGVYETDNFSNAKKKIYLVLKGGLSDLKVSRYN